MTANRYLDRLVGEGLLEFSGETRGRRYKLKQLLFKAYQFDIDQDAEEHLVWRRYIAPHLSGLPKNILEMCEYGSTEMINNVIDHSESNVCYVAIERDARSVSIWVFDEGVGIFNKIARECNLADKREAILELSKGKLTTDPDRHSGEGIFFTSRMFSEFRILSDDLVYLHDSSGVDDDWLIEADRSDEPIRGTRVALTMHLDATHTIQGTFRQYESNEDGVGIFSKTHVPIRLALYPNEQLVSRSQARRVLSRFNRFAEVILDFDDVSMIGQAFADEVFRVFRNANPGTKLFPIRYNKQIREMILRAMAGADTDQPDLFDRAVGVASGDKDDTDH